MTIQQDGVLVATGGHLHPGGLWTDLYLERDGRRVRLFRSRAKYFEPAGAVSWDVAMEVTQPDWRVGVKAATCCRPTRPTTPSAPPGTRRWEIMQVAFNPGGSGPDPFATAVDVRGRLTHGHLNENRNHGGAFGGLADPRKLLAGPVPRRRTVTIDDFLYGAGDLLRTGVRRRPPTIRRGTSLKFVNRDGDVMHSITSCKAPCNRTTGVAYPLADGPVQFDSGNLGWLRPAGDDRGGAARDVAHPKGLRART